MKVFRSFSSSCPTSPDVHKWSERTGLVCETKFTAHPKKYFKYIENISFFKQFQDRFKWLVKWQMWNHICFNKRCSLTNKQSYVVIHYLKCTFIFTFNIFYCTSTNKGKQTNRTGVFLWRIQIPFYLWPDWDSECLIFFWKHALLSWG